MSIDAATCTNLISDIYDVALGRRSIEQVLGDLARLGGVGRAAVITLAPSGRKSIDAASDLDASAIDSYNRDYHRFDAILPVGGRGRRCSSPARRPPRRSVRATSAAISSTPGRVRTARTRSPS